MRFHAVLLGLVACLRPDVPPAATMPRAVTLPEATPAVAAVPAAAPIASAPVPVPVAPPSDEVWLRGSTHVHAKPSGDSTTPIPVVIAWYEKRGYDFIAITDHNRVSEIDPSTDTLGKVALRPPGPNGQGLIVLSGIELTYNPTDCLPQMDPKRRCRIHVNLLGATARPGGKLEWADRRAAQRADKYQAAITAQRVLGGLIQLNHPQWFWGTTPELMIELAKRGVTLVEIANVQFEKWNRGDAEHPSTEQLWDAALGTGAQLWGVASDDAHHYHGGGEWPAGGGWVVVRARRDPDAILASLAAGRFYASTGVVLERAGAESNELVVEVAPREAGTYTIELVENGKLVATVRDRTARYAIPATGYVRAIVTRDDGKKAWIQPARRGS